MANYATEQEKGSDETCQYYRKLWDHGTRYPGVHSFRAGQAPAEEAARTAQAVHTPRAPAAGPAYIEVARDGRLYRIPLRRQPGTLEASRNAEEARRLQEAALARQAGTPAPSGLAGAGAPGRQPGSVVEFTLRYEVPK